MGLSFPGLYSVIYGAVPLGDEIRAEGSLEVHWGVRVQILAEIGLNGEGRISSAFPLFPLMYKWPGLRDISISQSFPNAGL